MRDGTAISYSSSDLRPERGLEQQHEIKSQRPAADVAAIQRDTSQTGATVTVHLG